MLSMSPMIWVICREHSRDLRERTIFSCDVCSGLILGLRPANERRRYFMCWYEQQGSQIGRTHSASNWSSVLAQCALGITADPQAVKVRTMEQFSFNLIMIYVYTYIYDIQRCQQPLMWKSRWNQNVSPHWQCHIPEEDHDIFNLDWDIWVLVSNEIKQW